MVLRDGTELTHELIAVYREIMENDMIEFGRFFFDEIKGSSFLQYKYLLDINKELIKVSQYDTKVLIINIPPRFGKTMMAAVLFIAWSLAKNPKARFLYITASDILRNTTSSEIREIVQHPLYQAFWDVKFKQDSNAKNNWITKVGGGLSTATINGQITGLGAGVMKSAIDYDTNGKPIFDGCVIMDDVNKIKDAVSENKNNAMANELFFSTIMTRKNTPWTGFINIQQRAGFNDMTNNLLTYYDPTNNNIYENLPKEKKEIVKHLVMPVISDGNKLLCEEKLDLNGIEKLKKHPETGAFFSTQFMQEPASKHDLLFPISDLQRFSMNHLAENLKTARISYIDTADGGTDFYCQIFGVWTDEKLYIVDVIYSNWNLTLNRKKTVAKLLSNKTQSCMIETNKEGSSFIDPLKEELKHINFYGIHNSVNKITRMLMQQNFVLDYFLFRNDYKIGSDYDKFMTALTKYSPAGDNKNDDAPDATCGLSNFIRKQYLRKLTLNKNDLGLF